MLGVDDLEQVDLPAPEPCGAVQQVVLPHAVEHDAARVASPALPVVGVPGLERPVVVHPEALHVLDREPHLGLEGEEGRAGQVAVGEDVLGDPTVHGERRRPARGDALDDGDAAGLQGPRNDLVELGQVLVADVLQEADGNDPDMIR